MNHADDRIFRSTRLVAAIIVPILLLAFLILAFFPDQTGQRFAWEIRPAIQSLYMGAGYLGGAWLFFQVIIGSKWHRAAAGFAPVTAFTISMLLLTILHWERFNLHHFPFILWLGLYLITPFLIPFLWYRNRITDPGNPEPGDRVVPNIARWGLGSLGVMLLIFAFGGFLFPNWLISFWVWPMLPLGARVLSGWFSLLGVGGVVIAREIRWSAWKVGLQSIGLWHLIFILGAPFYRADFSSGLVNWYTISVVFVLVGMAVLYGWMERGRDQTLSPRT